MANAENHDTYKKVLIICDRIQEINRLRRVFDKSFAIKATSSVQNGASIAESSDTDIIIYHTGTDYSSLFAFYKEIRTGEKTAEIPLIVIADMSILKQLTDTVRMIDTSIVGTMISQENILVLINSLIETEQN